jgi:hypothetical protein
MLVSATIEPNKAMHVLMGKPVHNFQLAELSVQGGRNENWMNLVIVLAETDYQQDLVVTYHAFHMLMDQTELAQDLTFHTIANQTIRPEWKSSNK